MTQYSSAEDIAPKLCLSGVLIIITTAFFTYYMSVFIKINDLTEIKQSYYYDLQIKWLYSFGITQIVAYLLNVISLILFVFKTELIMLLIVSSMVSFIDNIVFIAIGADIFSVVGNECKTDLNRELINHNNTDLCDIYNGGFSQIYIMCCVFLSFTILGCLCGGGGSKK